MKMPPVSGGGDFTPPPTGTHPAICYRIIDLGTQQVDFQGERKHQHKIMIGWELTDELMADGRPFTIASRYTYSSHEKSRLRPDLESWRGAKFTDAEIEGFDLSKLLGQGCLLTILHNVHEGKTYANVASVSKLPKSIKTGAPSNPVIIFSLADRPFNEGAFNQLSESLQAVIQKSPEYAEAVRAAPGDHVADAGTKADDMDDDDIPF